MSLPRRAWVMLVRALRFVAAALKPITGSVSWSRPPWLATVTQDVQARPRLHLGRVGVAVAVFALGWAGWQWYLHRPHPPEPERITFEAIAPAVTDYELPDGRPGRVIHPLDIQFSGSAAPIELVGKVARGVTLNPEIKGRWGWVDDRTLRFVPAQDWPVGAHIEVAFDIAQAFAPHVLMADDHCAFDIAPFKMTAGSGEFYQDPQNATAKKTIMPLTFNYPVAPAELEKRIALTLDGRAGKPSPLKFTVTYDAAKLKAWVHSQPLNLPRDDDSVSMKIDAGVASSLGGNATTDPVKVTVRVPGLYSLSVNDFQTPLVNNDRFEPQQVIVLTLSGAVKGSDLAGGAQAWILPKRNPREHQPDDAPPYAWEYDQINDATLRQSTPLKLELVPTENEYAEFQSFKYHATPGDRVYVRFAPGLRSFGGYIMGKPDVQVFTAPDYPKLLRFMADGSLLSMSGDRHVSIVSRNVPGLRLEIGRVLPDQLQHLVSFNSGTYSHPDFYGSFGPDHIVERFVEKRAIPKGDPGQSHYEGVDLGQYLQSGRHGIFLLHLASYDPKDKSAQTAGADDTDSSDSSDNSSDQTSDSRLVVVTDLGLLAKRGLDGTQDVFVQSIHTGEPVGGASVSVMAINGETLFSDTSSPDGVVHFPSLKGLTHEKKPALYVVRKGDDVSFLPIKGQDRKLDYSRFDVGGDANAESDKDLSAYLFSDRGIYRPGDLFHIGMIVRTARWSPIPAGLPLDAEIVDPRGVTVKWIAVTVDASGFGELSYTPSETAPTGTWTINLYLIGKDHERISLGSTTVSVKEFLPDSMKVDATLSAHVADGWVAPAGLKGIVDAHNLFGTPAANRRVEASLTLRPAFPAFRNWPDFQFYDAKRAKDGYTTQLQDGHTDDKGHAEFDLDLKKYADATYQLTFLAKAYEAEGGRSVAAAADTLVSSNAWLVGYRTVDDLSYIKRGSHRAVRLVAIDPQTKSIALKGLTAQLIERRYVSVLTKQDSGVYKYESRLKEIPLNEAALIIEAGGSDYVLPTGKPGDFALVIRMGAQIVNRIEYSVTGAANLSRSLDRNAELEIKLSKQDYAPGEQVEISLRAPYTGSGLITIERDKVYAHAWFVAKTTNSIQHITVPKDFEGNGYINVQYIRDPSSDEIFMSPLSYGVVPFSVNVDARRNALKIDAPDLVKPGETATFKLHAAHPTRAVLFAVDEGILQVAHYKLGDPLQYFFRKRELDVQTAQILDLILPDFKKLMSLAAPGGDNDNAIGRQLNPFKRHRDKPVVFWSGIVDVNGERDFQYAVPDYFHGKLRVMAVAVSPSLIGIGESATTVRGDFVLSPDAPTTLAPGDEADVGVGVSNNLTGLTTPVPVSITLHTGPQLQIVGSASQTIALASAYEGVATFRVRATGALGSGSLVFTAGYAGKSTSQRIDISVRPAAPYRSEITIGRVEPYSKYVASNLRTMYDAYSRRDASISTVPLVLTQGLTSWLVNYDNYCSEQIVSMSMPRLVASKWSQLPVFERSLQPVRSLDDNANALGRQIDMLRTRQNEQGGFGLWTATPDAEPFVSAYAMHFLLEARERGAAVPNDIIDAGNRYLRVLAADESQNSLPQLRERAYAVYLLTRQGNVTTNLLAAVQKRLQEAYPKDWRNDLAAGWLAASYAMLKQDKPANLLIAPLQQQLERTTDNGIFDYGYYDDPLIRDTTTLYLLARHFPERTKNLSPRVMENIVRPLEHDEFNTLSAAMTMLALDAYAGTNAGAVDKLGIDEIHGNGSAKAIALLQGKLLQAGSWSGATTRLRFSDASAVPAWYVIDQEGYDRGAAGPAIRNGIEIIRTYMDKAGNPLDRVVLGEEISVHVKIRATGDKGVGDVAIVDLLPGGFDPVLDAPQVGNENTPFANPLTSQRFWTPSYTDVREDRVVIYGTASPAVEEFVYHIKASASGRFIVPPAYAESMYDRRVQARSAGGGVLTVSRP